MILQDLHMHSAFSDGRNTAGEMVLSAIEKGLTVVGLSDHSWSPQDPDTMPFERYPSYRAEVARLKEQYRGQITVLCGIEQDLDTENPPEGFDYVIGSVHFLRRDGEDVYVDWSPEKTADAVSRLYGGDALSYCEHYYSQVAKWASVPCDIVGHFDLVTKFNERLPLIDTAHPRYIAAWRKAADALLAAGRIFEINTGAISRGWRTSPYPSPEILAYLKARGARFVLSSDSHSAANIAFQFDQFASLAADRLVQFPLVK